MGGQGQKKSLSATETSRPAIRKARRDWVRRRLPRMRDEPHRLVFVDETSVKTNMVRLRGRAPVGRRLCADAPFGRWRTQTFVAGLTADALIAPWIIEGAMDGALFTDWVETQLAPELAPGTVVILDNLSTHRVAPAAEALRRAGCWFLFLPPYSPDLNPIEMAFAKLKAHLRRIGARTFDDLSDAIGSICRMFSADECRNYLRHAGYAPT
ncbi:Transposase [Jannaschia seohaensis]|uniref:Transposase n=1 Tax=Jannaschia seohaensis TaxID=475081 RepID=A0A2Y9C3S9_9RHOB|nr:transposase [Jannaschia seohaensis]SSA52022.1 Transposase [Jannaschia seohaensis]